MASNGRGEECEDCPTRWTCDVCRIKAFDSFEAALEHEKTCTGAPRARPAGGVAAAGGGMIDLTLEDSGSEICGDGGGGGGDSSTGSADDDQGLRLHDEGHQQILAPPSLNRPHQQHSFVPPSPQQQQEPQPQAQPSGRRLFRFAPVAGAPQGIRPPTRSSAYPQQLISSVCTPTRRTNHRDTATTAAELLTATIWTCDKCCTAEFPTFEEAAEHERNCSVTNIATSSGFANVANSAIARAPGFGNRCAIPRAPIVDDQRYWTCDVCGTAHFRSYEEAVEHEKVCEGNPHAPVKSITTKRPLDGEDESQLTEAISMEGINCWSCDKCLVSSFPTYEDAKTHELNCRRTTNSREQHHLAYESVPTGKSAQPVPAIPLIDRDDTTDTERIAIHAHHQKEEEKVVLLPPQRRSRHQHQHHQLDSTYRVHSLNPSKKEPKRSRQQKSVEHLKSEEYVYIGGVLDRDIHGNEYYLPPTGGVPLVSSQSVDMCSKLSRYYQLVVENLELYQVRLKVQSGTDDLLLLRCQNCKSNPRLNTIKHLSNIKTWYKAVKQMASSHVSVCPCLDPYTKQKIEMSEKAKMDETLVTFCDYLASLYGMENSKNGVVWGECKLIESNFMSTSPNRDELRQYTP